MINDKIIEALSQATKLTCIDVMPMPLATDAVAKRMLNQFNVNIGPLPFDLARPLEAYERCRSIISQVLMCLGDLKEARHCRFGISIFAEPGRQSDRILSGWIDIDHDFFSDLDRRILRSSYSNIPCIREILSNPK